MPRHRGQNSSQVFSRRSLVEPLQNLPRALPSLHSSLTAHILIVGVSLLDEPVQDLEVTILGSSTGQAITPRTALPLCPAQDVEVTFTCSVITNTRVPRAGRVLSPHPLEHLKVTALSCPTTRQCPTRTALCPQPLHHLQLAAMSSPTTSHLIPQLTELFLWPLAPVLLKHLEVAFVSRNVENSLDEFRIGVTHIELPAPVRTPVLREGGVHFFIIIPHRHRHELPARPHLRLSQLLGHQSEGAHVVLIELPRDLRPHLRRKLDLFVFLLRSLALGLELRVPQLQPLDLFAKCLDHSGRGAAAIGSPSALLAAHVARSLALRRLVSVALLVLFSSLLPHSKVTILLRFVTPIFRKS